MKYIHLVLGGTFDLLHLGHQSFLSQAFKFGEFVTIGLTTDNFNKLRGKPAFEGQNLRLKNLKLFLTKENYIKRSKILFINDIFGTTLIDPTLKAIVVTSKTKKVVNLINQKRIDRKLNKLDIVTIPFTKNEKGQIISSSRIRDGEINTFGQSYKSMLLKIAGKKLSETARTKLKKPLGNFSSIPSTSSNPPIITVGDVTTANLLRAGLSPKLAVLDLKVQRKKIATSPSTGAQGPRNDGEVIKVKNPPGQISRSLILAVDRALRSCLKTVIPSAVEESHSPDFMKSVELDPSTRVDSRPSVGMTILVDGEEDLATIPAILLSPLGTTVYYGQPNKGLVEVKIDLEIKDYLCKILKLN